MLFKQPFSQVPPQAIAVSPVRYLRIAPETRIRRIVGPSSLSVEDELAQARIAWKRYQSTRKRDAIYDYLRAVFKIVRGEKRVGSRRVRIRRLGQPAGPIGFETSSHLPL